MDIDSLLKALADPTRLRILRLLDRMELAVGEVAQVLGQSQPRVSRHIRILCEAGLAARRKEGSWAFLRSAIGDAGESALGAAAARLLAAGEEEDALFAQQCKSDRRRLADIRDAREAKAAEYFARHAVEWDTLRSLHSPDELVEEALSRQLGRLASSKTLGSVLDIGTGTGRMAELLAPMADHVTALDKVPEMLRIARARLQALPADKVDLVQGDFAALPFADACFDTILFHQVLHYAQEPRTVMAEAARVLRPGGLVAVVDFAAHALEELRERHAHARLGFSDERMQRLLAEAGLDVQSSVAIPGSPLTVMIWTASLDGAGSPASAKTPLATVQRT